MVTLDTGNRFCKVDITREVRRSESEYNTRGEEQACLFTGAPLHITDEKFTHIYQKAMLLVSWVLKITFA